MENRKAGFIIDVPVTLSIAVRGVDEKQAIAAAREFAESIEFTDDYVRGYMGTKRTEEAAKFDITEVSFEATSEETAEVLDELEADDPCAECGLIEGCHHTGCSLDPDVTVLA